MSITEDVQQLEPGRLIELFELDCTAIGGDVLRFHGHLQSGPIFWQGNEYTAWPIEASGFERTGDAQQPSPTITVGNIDGVIGAMCLALGDLVDATVRRHRTFGKYLDAKNFPVSVTADEVQFGAGDGATANFQLVDDDGRPVTQSITVESIYRADWQGRQQLSAAPRTNGLTYSNAFGNWGPQGVTLTPNAATAPDGSLTAWHTADASAALTSKNVVRNVPTLNPATANALSVFAQAAEYDFILLRIVDVAVSSNYAYAIYDVSAGVVVGYSNVGNATGAAADIEPMLDAAGWYRCILTATPNPSATTLGVSGLIAAQPTASNGNNRTGTVGDGAYIFDAQLEDGAIATSHIPTTTAPVTVVDYAVSDSGQVTLGQVPARGAQLTWNGEGQYVSNPTAEPDEEFPPELWYIEQKSGDVFPQIEFTLGSALNLHGQQVPARPIVANVCMWLSIGGYRGAYCGYTGATCFDANDNAVDDPSQDRCGGRLNSCKARFGANNPLPIGSFPAADLTSDVQ